MGCDIHLYREKKVGNSWVTADKWEVPSWADDGAADVPFESRAYTGRNYKLFGALSRGVRSEFEFSFAPRGVPFNMSHEVAGSHDSWGVDGHSHNYIYLHELRDFLEFISTKTIKVCGMKNANDLAALRASISSGAPDWSKLFPYCEWANSPGYEEFELDVPASFYLGDEIQVIINSFDGVDGENHRIVFWFDN